jgi:hypothetical protein
MVDVSQNFAVPRNYQPFLRNYRSFQMATVTQGTVPPQFPDIDSFDPDLFSDHGNDLDPLEDSFAFNCDFLDDPSFSNSAPKIEARRVHRRDGYGLGVDARRSARYLAYPKEASAIHKHLHHVSGIVTKEMLHSLIMALISRCSPNERPSAPTRAQRRVKGGLVAWLDEHESMALSYLRSQNASS